MTQKILFVDDDANLLAGVERQLRKRFFVDTAPGGSDGLEALAVIIHEPPPAAHSSPVPLLLIRRGRLRPPWAHRPLPQWSIFNFRDFIRSRSEALIEGLRGARRHVHSPVERTPSAAKSGSTGSRPGDNSPPPRPRL
jgi:hypothetical protein